METLAATFEEDGFAIVEDAVSTPVAAACRELASAAFDACVGEIAARELPFGMGAKEGFADIVQRSPQRYEMQAGLAAHGHPAAPGGGGAFGRAAAELRESVLPLARAALGGDAALVSTSVLMALPGAATQGWHADGGHLSPTEHLPCHCLNVFVPLVDVSLAEVGRSAVGCRRRGEA
jgi:hypothetical protein